MPALSPAPSFRLRRSVAGAGWFVLVIAVLCTTVPSRAVEAPRAAELSTLTPGAWTAVWITDTQYYTEAHGEAGIFLKMTDWVVANAERRALRAVWHTGDIVDNNDPGEWRRARACLAPLDGRVPYILCLGNHDLGERGRTDTRSTYFNAHFRLADNPLNAERVGGRYEAGRLENAYWFLDEGPWRLLVFGLEFGVRPEVAAWAGGIAALHPERKAVLLTHDFLDDRSRVTSADGWARRTRPESGGSPQQYPLGKTNPEGVLSGEGIWEHLVSRHPNFRLTLNGHHSGWELVDGKPQRTKAVAASYRMDPGADGRPVHQMFFNAQFLPDGGSGWLRLLEFQPDGVTVHVKTFSPLFAMDNDPATPEWHPDPRMHAILRME